MASAIRPESGPLPGAAGDAAHRRRLRAIAATREAEALVAAAGGEPRVFGSLAEDGGGRFGPRPDIDALVSDLPRGVDGAMAAEVFALLAERGFEADVVPERFAPASLLDRVARDGRRPRDDLG